MKDYILSIAKYNKHANLSLIKVLKTVKPEDYSKDTGCYFKSVKGISEHILWADMRVFSLIKTFSSKSSFKNEEIMKYVNDNFSLKPEANKDFETFVSMREKMDNLIIDIISSIEDFEELADFKRVSGEVLKKKRIHIIFHILNHATHHRGELSSTLDRLGYSNDFAAFIATV